MFEQVILFPTSSNTQPVDWRRTTVFVDGDRLELDNLAIVAKSYKAAEHLAVAAWNPTSERQPLLIQAPGYCLTKMVTVDGEQTCR